MKANMKTYEIVTLNKKDYNIYPFDTKYSDYNFIVLEGFIRLKNGESYSRKQNLVSASSQGDFEWKKEGNTLVVGSVRRDNSDTIKVLFYK